MYPYLVSSGFEFGVECKLQASAGSRNVSLKLQ